MIYAIYDKATRKIVRQWSGQPSDLALNVQPGQAACMIENRVDDRFVKVSDDGTRIVDKTPAEIADDNPAKPVIPAAERPVILRQKDYQAILDRLAQLEGSG